MAALGHDFTDCSIYIYDANDNRQLCFTVVTHHDTANMRLQIQEMPPELATGSVCRLLIISSRAPYEYQGRVVGDGANRALAIFQGQEMENRRAERHIINTTAVIEKLIYDGKPYPLHTPLEVELINISKSGVRLRTPFYSLTNGDSFQMRFTIGDQEKQLVAAVTNHIDKDSQTSEYGCRFVK